MKTLVDTSTGRAVQIGEIVPSFRGEGMFYAGLSRGDTMVLARRPRQDGQTVRPSDLCGEYYPTVDDILEGLNLAILEALDLDQGVESGALTKSTKHVRGELRWPYPPYGEKKLELSLEIKAGIPRGEES